jgi:membrane associated rhomboid family serine protease
LVRGQNRCLDQTDKGQAMNSDNQDPDPPKHLSLVDEIPDNIEGGPYRPVPEDFEPSPPKKRQPLSYWPEPDSIKGPLLIWLIFWVCSYLRWTGRADLAVSANSLFQEDEWWRTLTALFAHSDVQHLLSNSPMFLIFGTFLGNYFGKNAFPLASLVIGILTNIITVSLHTNPNLRLLGASGMVYGMVGLWLVYYIKFAVDYNWALRFMRAIAFALVVMYPSTYHPQVSYTAHLVGFVIGLVWGLATMNYTSVYVPARPRTFPGRMKY